MHGHWARVLMFKVVESNSDSINRVNSVSGGSNGNNLNSINNLKSVDIVAV